MKGLNMNTQTRKPTALLSVYDKSGVTDFARELQVLGFDILASGGTARHLKESGVEVRDVADFIGDPILGHRVVTLSREIHAALLATDSAEDWVELAVLGIPRIDLVYVNLYPLQEEIRREGSTLESVIEKTDIGGPTMLRSAAKGRRLAVCRPSEIPFVLDVLRQWNRDKPFNPRHVSHLAAIVEMTVGEYSLASADFHRRYAERKM